MKQVNRMVVSLVASTRLKKTYQQKNIIPMNKIAIQYNNHVINEMTPKVNCFAGFCHHRLVTRAHIRMRIAILCLKVE